MSNQSNISSPEQIAAAAAAFWGVIADKFPEITSGDTTNSGEDLGAFGLWANGHVGDEPFGMPRLDIPSYIEDVRVTQAVTDGMEAAKAHLHSVNEAHYGAAFAELDNCTRELIRYNAPEPGTFVVDVYRSKEEWDAAKGATESYTDFDNLDDAKQFALDDDYADAYQVAVKAYGYHKQFEAGEVVYERFDRKD
jgi:hypothetical protein